MLRVPISWEELTDRQLLLLARRAVRELNDQSLTKFKVVAQ